jgi:hypothetical protein
MQMPRWRWTTSPQGASLAGWGASSTGREGDGTSIPCSHYHDTRRYAIPQCWAPHTQTQKHGVRR